MKKFTIIIIASTSILMLGACGTTGSVLKMGPDAYKVSASKHNMAGGAPSAENEGLSKANTHCEMLSKELLVTNTSKSFERPFYNFSATFLCLDKSDERLKTPIYQNSPDLIIEQRNR